MSNDIIDRIAAIKLTEDTRKIKRVLLRHKPCITIESYCTHVFGCSCEKFIPKGDDAQSWKDWAAHVAKEIQKWAS